MHDDDEESSARREYPLSTGKMSKTPSWVMLGFFLGAVTVWSVVGQLRKEERVPRAVTKADAEPAVVRYVPQPVTTVEAVFADWEKYAVWENDLTEVALWNEAGAYTDCYEVLRYAGRYYFRSIPTLTRRPIKRGKYLETSPLLFTETEEQYQEWKQHGRTEQPVGDYRPLSSFSTATGGAGSKNAALPRPEVVPLPPPKFEAIAPFDVGNAKGKEKQE